MNIVTSTIATCALLLFSGHAAPQDDSSPSSKDELAATIQACGKPISINDQGVTKAGGTRKVIDYPGVSLWFRKNAQPGSEFFLSSAVRTNSPASLAKDELIEILPCVRKLHFLRLK